MAGGLGKLAALVGREGVLTTSEGLRVAVRIVDVRIAYGRREVQVEPLSGSGRAWVTSKRVRIG